MVEAKVEDTCRSVLGALVVGATIVVGASVVGAATVVGATVVGAAGVVGASVVGASGVGASVVGEDVGQTLTRPGWLQIDTSPAITAIELSQGLHCEKLGSPHASQKAEQFVTFAVEDKLTV